LFINNRKLYIYIIIGNNDLILTKAKAAAAAQNGAAAQAAQQASAALAEQVRFKYYRHISLLNYKLFYRNRPHKLLNKLHRWW
jgi:hypothetical protein